MKQSSIEWLHSNNETICEMLLLDKIPKSTYEQLINCFSMNLEHAKAMHKEEIMGAHGEEQNYLEDDGSWRMQTAEEYYNETFNTNQENLQDSTNGYTYYPQENKTVFNTKEK